jgi:hypothetical protein
MTHRRKIWISENESKAAKNKKNWRVCLEWKYISKEIDFPFSNTILDDYLMFRVVINDMIESEKMNKSSINFKIENYSNKNHAEIEKVVKKRDLKIEIWHYLIIYQTFQLHDEKRKRENLRRFLLDVLIIKVNEILSDICVVQSKARDKLIIKFIIKFKKTAKESIRLVTFVQIRSKRRNSKKKQNQQKRFKRSEVHNIEKEVINLKTNEFDVKSRKTRSQIRKKIIRKLKTAISIKEFKTSKKTYIMSKTLQFKSHHHTSIFSSFVKNISDVENKLIVFLIAKSNNSK